MRLIYTHGFSMSEREEWRAIIFNNVMAALKLILGAMGELKIELENQKNEVNHPILSFSHMT